MMKKIFSLLLIFCGSVCFAQSSPPIVSARFSADSILIGDHFYLDIDIDKDISQVTDFPVFDGNKLGENIEILEESGVDTLSKSGRMLKLHKRYRLTSFDAGIYGIDSFPILYSDKNIVDTLYSADKPTITVTTFAIDTTKQTLRDIKAPLEMPVKFGEFSGYLFGGLLLLAILIVAIWLIVRYYRAKKNRVVIEPVPVESAHEHALKELEQLENEKLWQSGKVKQYYTKMTDILREYVEHRYLVSAMEMTSAEIVDVLKDGVDVKVMEGLKSILITADYVKFAKYIPEPSVNTECYNNSVLFVENTKFIPLEEKQ